MSAVKLQSQDHRDLLDVIDGLRSIGISSYVDLPQIVVCGDQSAGKSSVLEAISGFSFPTSDGLCTRFATELILRRDANTGIKISIVPDPETSAEDKARYSKFNYETNPDDPQLGQIVNEAKNTMGISDVKRFSTDILRVELSGPQQPHLTIVDLPGLFRAGNMDQSNADSAIVKSMVRGYMKRERTIIMVVVSAKAEIVLQDVTEFARELDPKGVRTLGVITKPDTLDRGSESEATYLRLARNEDMNLRLGWHVLKNRSYDMRDSSLSERNRAEKDFFSSGLWLSLDKAHVGADALVARLSDVLKEQIVQQLPKLRADVSAKSTTCRARLERLGDSRQTLQEQRSYLLRVSGKFQSLVKAAVDGTYSYPFFGSATTAEGYQKRLRAVVQDELKKFSDTIHQKGRYRTIVDDTTGEAAAHAKLPRGSVYRSDYVAETIDLIRRSRGRELMGSHNPLLVGDLFLQQCQPWKAIAEGLVDVIVNAVQVATWAALSDVAIEDTADGLLQMINRDIDGYKDDLEKKVAEMLHPHLHGHPITYNHYLTDTVQKIQSQRQRSKIEKSMKAAFGNFSLQDTETQYFLNPMDVVRQLEADMDCDMDSYAAELAVDYMQAYYKVALKRFVDDVSVLAVEKCIIQKLPGLLPAEMIFELSDKEIQRLAGESTATSDERKRCSEMLKTFDDGLQLLKRYDTIRTIAGSSPSQRSDTQEGDDTDADAATPENDSTSAASYRSDGSDPEDAFNL